MESSYPKLVNLVFFAFLALSGCASVEDLTSDANQRVQQAVNSLQAQPLCCQQLSSANYNLLAPEGRTALSFSPSSAKARTFDSGKSYFHGIKLPTTNHSDVLFVRSHMSGGGRNKFPTIFIPTIQFLNENHLPLTPPKEVPLCFYRGWTALDVGYFGKVKVPKKARFAVIYTNYESLNKTVSYGSSATTAGGGIVYEATAQYDFPRNVDGTLDIWSQSNSNLEKTLDDRCWN